MTTKVIKKGANDASRFEGNGISYKAKLIGIEDVPEARGDVMCQETITKLKNSIKINGQHKQKIFVNVTLEGLKIIDAISLLVLHTHPVHRISFISRDTTDNRAFGYVFGEGSGAHKFFGIKTAAAAEQLVLTLRDLFMVVYEMKKKEMDDAKEKYEKGEVGVAGEGKGNEQASGSGSTSGNNEQTPQNQQTADAENIYQVPSNNAPVNPETQAEEVANLLDLEDQAEHILKGIEQIKNLEFDSMTEDPPVSPMAKLAPPSAASTGQADPWGLPAESAPNSTSSMGDLAGLQTSPFSTGGFGGTSFPATPAPFSAGLPVAKDPFAIDPFGGGMQRPAMPAMPAGGPGFTPSNPFGTPTFGASAAFGAPAPYGAPAAVVSTGINLGRGAYGVMPAPPGLVVSPGGGVVGVPPSGMMAGGNPFPVSQPQMGNAFGGDDPNLLMPIRKDDGGQSSEENDPTKLRSKSPRADLFGDLVDIKKTDPDSSAKTPKDMFSQMNASERKSMNQLQVEKLAGTAVPASGTPTNQASSPFGDAFAAPAQPVNGTGTDKSVQDLI